MNGTADSSVEIKNDKKPDGRMYGLPPGWIKLNVGGKVRNSFKFYSTLILGVSNTSSNVKT